MAVGPVRGVVLIDVNKCVRCGKCVELCPCRALALKNGIVTQIGFCMACFGCQTVCPTQAIKVELDKESYRVVEVEMRTEKHGVRGLERFFRSASHHHERGG